MSLKSLAVLVLSTSAAWAQAPGATQYTISTLAGNGVQGFGKDGPASGAEFSTPTGIAVDSTGAIYVGDGGNNRVRQILGGTVSTYAGNGTASAGCQGEEGNVAKTFTGPAGSAELFSPAGLAVRGTGDIFVADEDNNCIREVTGGNVKTYAGNGVEDPSEDNILGTGQAVNAELQQPTAVAWDAKNNLLYIAEVGAVRVVNASGVIETVTGSGIKVPVDGLDPTTAFVDPMGLAVDSSGNLYISDHFSHTVFKIANGTINIVAGGGSSLAENVLAKQAELLSPMGLAFDPSGNLLIADSVDCRIRVVSASTGMINTIAGSTGTKITCGYTGDATPLTPGTATLATLSNPNGIAVDSMGNIYVTDTGNNVIRQLTPAAPAPAVCPAPTVLPTTGTFTSAGGQGTFNITSPANCPWTATTTAAWITGLPQNGAGGANQPALAYGVMATTSSAQRTGTITVAGTGPNAGTPPATATFTITQAGVSCSPTFNPPGAVAPSADTKGTFNVTFNADDCAWLALSTLPWVSVTDGLTGTGKGDVGYEVTENKSVIPRPGAVIIDFLPFLILQLGASPTSTPGCSISFTPAPPANAPATGGSGNVGVNFPANATGCSYTASAVDTWVHVTSGITGSSNGTVGYTLDPNTTTSPRSGTLLVSGQPYVITEAAAAPIPACTPALNPASLPAEAAAGGSGTFAVTLPNNTCGWTASSNVSWLTVTSGLSGNGNGSVAYTIAANATSAARTGVITVSGQTFTVNQSGSTAVQNCSAGSTCPVTIGSIISASAYGGSSQAAPGSILEIYGTGLANDSRTWAGSDFQGASAPLALDGVTVTFNGQPGAVSYISAMQVNAQVPTTLSPGPIQVTVTNNGQTSAPYSLTLSQYAPGLLAPVSFNVNGNQYAVAFHADQSYVLPAMAIPGLTSSPAQPGETIVMYGIGMGPVADSSGQNIPGGQMVANVNSVVAPVQLFFGQTPAVITYAGLAPGYVGLYQVNAVVPQIAASDTVPLTFTLNGTDASQKLVTSVQ